MASIFDRNHIARTSADCRGLGLTHGLGESRVAVIEAFPGVRLWETFDENCKAAEAARDLAVQEAKRERDQVVKADPGWKVHSRHRINAAAAARCEQKVRAAQEECDAACGRAEQELMKALDQANRIIAK